MQMASRFFTCLCLSALTACATQPVQKPLSTEEVVKQDRVLGSELSQQLEAQIHIKNDHAVSSFLDQIANHLSPKNPVSVLIMRSDDDLWRTLSLPGDRIYISSELLKHFQFENETAAAIAYELAHLVRRDVARQLGSLEARRLSSDEFFGPDGIFDYKEESFLQATDTAVELLYKAGYDPRGLARVWELLLKNPAHSPYEEGLVRKLLDYTHQVIAHYAPLRNPIVRSSSFITIQKRIKRL